MSSPDKPFQLQGGNSTQANLHNRVGCIDRMEYILKDKHKKTFNFRSQTAEWLMLWDMEMYVRFYKLMPKDHPIDEEFCQRGAEVANAMIEDGYDMGKAMVDVKRKVQQAYKEYQSVPIVDTVKPEQPKKKKFFWSK